MLTIADLVCVSSAGGSRWRSRAEARYGHRLLADEDLEICTLYHIIHRTIGIPILGSPKGSTLLDAKQL